MAANWDSLVFDVGGDPLRRVPMMEPSRGTAAHVGTLIDECDTAAELLESPRVVTTGHGRKVDLESVMAEREQKRKPAPQREEEVVEEVPATSESGEKIKAELDDLLDEIDDVLEQNAEDFVKSYIQKGGQ